jgi:hypothetical protein
VDVQAQGAVVLDGRAILATLRKGVLKAKTFAGDEFRHHSPDLDGGADSAEYGRGRFLGAHSRLKFSPSRSSMSQIASLFDTEAEANRPR